MNPDPSFHSDGIDLAVRQGTPPFGASLQATRLFKQEVIAVAAPKLAGDSPKPLESELLAKLPKIHDTHDLWPKYLADIGMPDHSPRGLRLSQTALAVDAAIAGQGVTLVSRFLVSRDLEAGRLVEVGPTWDARGHDFYLLSERSANNRASLLDVTRWLTSRSSEES